jgi:EpsD family peptidyl-prolyl cis-trans isomerase
MKRFRGGLAAAAVSMALAGCHFPWEADDTAPTGQVVAKIGDREITLREVHSEMGDASVPDPKARKSAELVALNNIIGRTLLANAAREQGIDKTPDFAIQKTRALDSALVQALQEKLAGAVPAPTRQEAQDFVNSHPDMFAERKVFTVDQIRMPRPSDPAILKSLEPLKTLEQIESLLKADNIPYQRAGGSLDAVGADPRMIDQIVKLPPNEVFVIPGGNGLLVNQIRDTKVIPFTGEPAIDYASKYLTRERTQESIKKSFNRLMAGGVDKIRFNKDYAPPKAPPATSRAAATNTTAGQ